MKYDRFIQEVKEPIVLNSAHIAGAYLMRSIFAPFEQFEQEEFLAFTLNSRNRITHQAMVYRGIVNAVAVRPAELFRLAIRLNAWGLLFAHNHPSGDPDPSDADLQIHRTLCQGGELLGIKVVDHLVVGRNTWTSLRKFAP
jgi:DNA repair protein RadC